jgi:hypothetical protein
MFVGNWVNISSQFAGVFFRAEGGNASGFGNGQQGQDIISHKHSNGSITERNNTYTLQTSSISLREGESYSRNVLGSVSLSSPMVNFNIVSLPDTYNAGGTKTRPVNMTIRVWERTS